MANDDEFWAVRGPCKEMQMTRLGFLAFCAALSAGLPACSSDGSTTPNTSPQDGSTTPKPTPDLATATPKDPLEVVPLDNDLPGWIVDKALARDPNARAMTATTQKQVEGLIDGGAEDYFQGPNLPKMFLWQNYLNSTLSAAPEGANAKLYVFQLASAEAAKGFFEQLLTVSDYKMKAGTPDDWTTASSSLGDGSRIQDTASQWWINFHKGAFYVEVLMDPSYGPPPDYALGDPNTKAEALRFAEAIASRI
jgi:hypothetical protein